MDEITLVKDFAVIMVVAGAITLLFRKLRQPPILGYLIAGLIVGPYTLPTPPVTDIHTISLLADLGLVLLLFGLGLEFSWSKIRQIGLAVLLIGAFEILTMIYLGYSLGQLMGWSKLDSIFLGAALHISSSAIIVKILRDTGKLDAVSSRLVVGILVVEDFAAVIILTVLSGVSTTGTASIGDVGALVLRLVVFIAASLTLGAVIVPRVIKFTHQFRSKEALIITALALCFAMALIGKYLGLSVAAGAFLMGSLIGDTEHSEEIAELVSPIRDMFAAIFFVAIGMLINVSEFGSFIVPGIIVTVVFILGKVLSNTLATFTSGYDGRTALQTGMNQPIMGEFSLAIAKLGMDRGVVAAPIYPVITIATALTSLTAPYIMRAATPVGDLLNRKSPALLKTYVLRLTDWLGALRATFTRNSEVARKVRHSITNIFINVLIVIVVIGVGTLSLSSVQNLSWFSDIRDDIIGLVFGFVLLMLCMPSFVVIWRNLQSLVDEATVYVLSRRKSTRLWQREAVRIVLRDSILLVLSIFMLMWFIPFITSLLALGSYALAVPLLVLAVILYLLVRWVRHIHGQVEQNFARILLGKEQDSTAEEPPGMGRGWKELLQQAIKTISSREGGRRRGGRAEAGKPAEADGQSTGIISGNDSGRNTVDNAVEDGPDADRGGESG